MTLLLPAIFLLLTSLVVGAAWEPRPQWLISALVSCGIRRVSQFFVGIWIVLGVTFCWFFWQAPEFWQLLALLIEIAGVTYLAREVYFAQDFEEYRAGASSVKPFVDLEPLVDQSKLTEYVIEYYKLNGLSQHQAEVDISVAELFDTLADQVNRLKSQARRAFERPNGPLRDLGFRYRRARLLRGVVLVTIGLASHGLHTLMPHEQSEIAALRHVLDEMQSRFENSVSQSRKVQLELGQQIARLERDGASQAREIESITAENKRWHLVKVPLQRSQRTSPDNCCCTPVSTSCLSK